LPITPKELIVAAFLQETDRASFVRIHLPPRAVKNTAQVPTLEVSGALCNNCHLFVTLFQMFLVTNADDGLLVLTTGAVKYKLSSNSTFAVASGGWYQLENRSDSQEADVYVLRSKAQGSVVHMSYVSVPPSITENEL
jgi:hypothetical protein